MRRDFGEKRDRFNSGGGFGDGGGGGGFRPRGPMPEKQPPVRQGEELDVLIEAVGEKGDGIARKEGFVLFVPKTKQGQKVRVRITRVLRTVGFAEVIGEAQTPVQSQEAPTNQMPEEQAPESSPLDSEDFGEEAPAEPEEAPAEEQPAEPAQSEDVQEEASEEQQSDSEE